MSHDHKETAWSFLAFCLSLQDTVFRLPNPALRNILCWIKYYLSAWKYNALLLKAVCYQHTGKDLS